MEKINSSLLIPSGLPKGSKKLVPTTKNPLEERNNAMNKQLFELELKKQEFSKDLKQVQRLTDVTDLVRLNVGGERIVTRRRILTKIPNSTLDRLFNLTSQYQLHPDYDGSYFLDYNPVLFSHLLDQLRTLKKNTTPVFRPPPSSVLTKPFNKMLRELGLSRRSESENDLIALNVGGEKIVTLRKTLRGVPNSILARLASSKTTNRDRLGRPFLDYNPKLFLHLLDQLREGKKVDDGNLVIPSEGSKNAYEAMLIGLGLQSE
jgi:hypothetical protein